MKFLCPNCKAKYQISDEKIVGRTLKMDCRRCSHPIVIRGDKLAAEPEPAKAAKPASRPGSGSHVGPAPSRQSSRTALGADFRKNAGAAPPVAKPTALDQWHVAIHDVPVGPMKRDEVAQKIGAGAVTGESLCWREGFDDWRPLKEVPELAELLRRAAAPPPTRGLPRAAPPAGAPRPARPPAQRLPPQSPRPAESARPAARGNVVPIGGRLGAAAAPAVEDFSEDMPDDEPTRVGSSLDLIRAEEERAAEEARLDQQRKEQERKEEQRKEQQRKEEEEARARHAEEAARRDAAERDAARPAASFAEEDAFDPFASQRAPLEPAPAEPASAAPSQPLPPSASYAAPLVDAPPRRRGLPVGAWIAIAGAMAFGATLAVMVGIKMFSEPAPVAVVAPQPTPEPAGPTEAEPDPTLTAPATPDTEADPPPEDPEASDPRPTAPANNGSRAPREGSSAATPREPSSPSRPLDPAAAARLAQFEDDGAGAAPINVRDRNNPLNEDTRSGSGELSQDQIRTVVNRERSTVQRCYETAIRAAGQSPGMRIDVDLTIGSSGTVTSATARGPGFGSLNECIERTVRRWRFPASGGSSRLSIPFVFTGQD